MAKIESLIEDPYLSPLFDDSADNSCALQIWILQILQDQSTTSHLLYARLLPSSHQSNEWYAPKEDHFKVISAVKSQILPLTLYCSPSKAKNILKKLVNGKTLEDISFELDINISDNIKLRTKEFTIPKDSIFKPATLLQMRNSKRTQTIRSPHGTASALSASIILKNRLELFNINNNYSAELTIFAITLLNKDTGMYFHEEDSPRLGTIELLLFPTLDNVEKDNLHASWNEAKNTFTVELDLSNRKQNSSITNTSLIVHFYNDNQKIHSKAITQSPADGIVIFTVTVNEEKLHIIDSVQFEIFTFEGESSAGNLHCSYDVSYIRGNTLITRIGTVSGKSINFSWLTDVIKSSPKQERIKSLQAVNHGSKATSSTIKNDVSDPWVFSNRQMKSLIREAFPKESEGGFFQRFRDSGGLGRVEFVEWIHKVIKSYQEHQIVIFDPYFEDVGISLLLPKASTGSEYIVITTITPGQHSDRINNAVLAYQKVASITENINFKLYGISRDLLHDRYIIISDQNGKPIKGYHLSNSLQNATDLHPMLITVIPEDILPNVSEYTHQILSRSMQANQNLDLLIDSKNFIKQKLPSTAYEPLAFLDSPLAGKVIAGWIEKPGIANLPREDLKHTLTELGYTRENTLNSKKFGPPQNFLTSLHKISDSDLSEYWEIGATILAHSTIETLNKLVVTKTTIKRLSLLLFQKSETKPSDDFEPSQEIYISSTLRTPMKELISHARVSDFVHPTKFKSLSWGDFYIIKFLWEKDPSTLLNTLEYIDKTIDHKHPTKTIACSIAAQIICEISMSAMFGLTQEYTKLLIMQKNSLMRWFGYSSIATIINKNSRKANIIISVIEKERRLVSGWLIHNSYRRETDNKTNQKLIKNYLGLFSYPLKKEDAKDLFENLRNHMKELSYCYPWLITDILNPLIDKNKLEISFAAEIWLDEIISLITKLTKNETSIFNLNHQAKTTDIAAFLMANSETAFQKEVLGSLNKRLISLKRKIQKPLASTTNWTEWDNHLKASFWIKGYLQWISYYLPPDSEIKPELEKISCYAAEVCSARSMNDWLRYDYSGGEYSVFLKDRSPVPRS